MKSDPTAAKFNWNYPNSWTEEYNYTCDNAYLRDVGKTMVLIINTSVCMILLYLADIIGRKPVFMIAATNITIGMVVNCVYPNLMVKLAGLGYAGGSEGIFSAIFTMMINEVTRNFFSFIIFSGEYKDPEHFDIGLFLRLCAWVHIHQPHNAGY